MFRFIVFILLAILLFLAGGAALHMGVFKAHCEETGFTGKVFGGIVSYGISGAVWFFMYSHHYLGW